MRLRERICRRTGSAGAHRACGNRCGFGRRAGARKTARGVRRRSPGCRLRERLCRRPGAATGRNPGLAARGPGGKTGRQAARAGAGGNRPPPCAGHSGHHARSAGGAARGGRCGALPRGRRGGGRAVARTPAARSDREPTAGAGGGGLGRHRDRLAHRSGALAQRRADPMAGGRRALAADGSQCARLSCLVDRPVAPTRTPGGRPMARGVEP